MSKSTRTSAESSGGRTSGHGRGTAAPEGSATSTRPTRGAKSAKERAWSEVASFVIHFERRAASADENGERRITAHKMQEGGITARWTGLAQQPMVSWIAEHLGDWGELPAGEPAVPVAEPALPAGEPALPAGEPAPLAAEPLRPAVAASPADAPTPMSAASQISLAISAVTARQGDATGVAVRAAEARQATRVRLRGDEAFDLDATIEISGATGSHVPPPVNQGKVQFFGRDMSTRRGLCLGEASLQAAGPGASTYSAFLGKVRLPAGTYRLFSVATLATRPAKLAHLEGPMLDVA